MKKIIVFLIIFGASATAASGQTKAKAKCEAPTSAITASVTDYAAKKYHLASSANLSLRDDAAANDECYWRYHYEATSLRRDITLYLAPDHRYITTALYDRLSDPLAEEKAQKEEMARTLIGINSPSRGPQNATVTIVEFSDFQCPYCQRLTNILEKEVLPGEPDVRVVFKNFPLAMHPFARSAAQLASCGGQQNSDAFWALHDYAFSHQKEFTADNIEEKMTAFADQQPGIDHKAYHACVDSGLSVGPVMKDEALGQKVGVHATPTVFINGSRVEGIRDAAQLKQLIASARSGQLPATPAEPISSTVARPVAQGNACTPINRTGAVDALR